MVKADQHRLDQSIGGRYPDRAARMAFPGKFFGRVHLNACRTGFMICPGLGPDYGRPCYDDRWGDESDWIDGGAAWTLFRASAAGDMRTVTSLLDDDPRLVNALHWYTQPVHMAARHGHADAVRLLLDRGADPGLNIFGSTWTSLLEEAQTRGFNDVADIIAHEMGARFGYDPAFGEVSALVKSGSADYVETALGERPELADRSDEDGNNGLHLGVLNGRKEMVELFLERGVPIDSRRADGKTPLTLSFDTGFGHAPTDPQLGLPEYLLERGAHYAVTAASYLGDIERVRQVLAEDPGSTGRDSALKSPLAYAARAGHEEIAALLLVTNTDSHAVDQALFEAVWYRHPNVAALLLKHGANPNVELDSCGCAAGTDDLEIRALLVGYGAVYPPSWGLSEEELRELVVSKATRVCDPYLVALVLETGDSRLIDTLLVDHPDALHRLAELQYLPGWGDDDTLTRKLVAAGLDPNRRTFEGQTYLHICARHGWEANARSLIEHGALVNALDEKDGQTPLAVAVRNGRIAMARLLLKHGADPDLADWPWTRPLSIAEESGNTAVAEVIRRHVRGGF
ncbi:MAG: ankyrin repeat domain-containing protein [Gemmatimonadetes bacterium]|nr:ankyrin repeat domain-containing protein [Gemmatimonadota bacterium]